MEVSFSFINILGSEEVVMICIGVHQYTLVNHMEITVLVVYIDDIIITGSDHKVRVKLEEGLLHESEIEKPRLMKFFYGSKRHILPRESCSRTKSTS